MTFRNMFREYLIFAVPVLIVLLLLYACAAPVETQVAATRIATVEPTQTPYVVVVTATDEPTAEVAEPTNDCRYDSPLANIGVGYIPDMDLGEKKSPVLAAVGCAVLTVVFPDGATLQGQLSEDGLALVSCALEAGGYSFPCEVYLKAPTNIQAHYFNKNGQPILICLAADNKSYNRDCE